MRMAGANKSAGGGRGDMMMPPPGQFMGLQSGFTWDLLGTCRCAAGLELAWLAPHVLLLCVP